jgi:hypothetical protein
MAVTPQRKGIGDYLGGCGGCLSSLAFIAVFLAIGGGLSIWGWTILQNARASSGWPAVTGRVVTSEVTISTDSEGDDSYLPRVVYRYVVNDVEYENNTIKFGENSYDSERRAQQVAGDYPAGSNVTVYHDPERPDQSVLEPGVSGGSYIVIGIGAVFVVISVIIAAATVYSRLRGSST